MYIEKKREIRRPITKRDIEGIRKRTRIGDTVCVKTINNRSENGELLKRKGTVTAKCPHFAVVRLPQGARYCARWAELIQDEREREDEGEYK